MSDCYVFLGPSLPANAAREILDAIYLPPVRAGDVCAVTMRSPRAIGIIDGLFEHVPSVWHKEILYAISQGIPVFGGGSMGALRAAELHTFGMVGVGVTFEHYRDGEYEDDDEVALLHGPASRGYAPSSVPMVNLREGLRRARGEGVIGASAHDALVRATKSRFYADRSWESLFDDARTLGIPAAEVEALARSIERDRPDVKRADAIAVLQSMARELTKPPPRPQPTFDFESTLAWRQMLAEEGDRVTKSELD